jgi:hypothetical protein
VSTCGPSRREGEQTLITLPHGEKRVAYSEHREVTLTRSRAPFPRRDSVMSPCRMCPTTATAGPTSSGPSTPTAPAERVATIEPPVTGTIVRRRRRTMRGSTAPGHHGSPAHHGRVVRLRPGRSAASAGTRPRVSYSKNGEPSRRARSAGTSCAPGRSRRLDRQWDRAMAMQVNARLPRPRQVSSGVCDAHKSIESS